MKVFMKRVYDGAHEADGYHVLVDRLWPRGVKKEQLAIDEWCKDVAPSTELREWFGHDPAKFKEFTMRYKYELDESGAAEELLERARKSKVITLLYAAKDSEHNHAVVLRKYLEGL